MDRIGQHVGDYILLRLLGRGSEADVYLGRHIYQGTLAAIKILATHVDNDCGERFVREAAIIGTLDHPRIVRLLGYNDDHRPPFMALEYIPGGTLRQYNPKGNTLPLAQVVDYVTQLADALQYIHDRSFIHRDIKPENILLDDQQRLFVSDFGLALSVAQSCQQKISYLQSVQGVAGTLSYMAPEQLQSHAIPASDQYSLAIMVYELLCGERPFQGALSEVLVKQMTEQPPSLQMKNSSIPVGIENVVMKALEKDPEQRFTTVADFAQELELAARGRFAVHYALATPVPQQVSDEQASSEDTVVLQTQQFRVPLDKELRNRVVFTSETAFEDLRNKTVIESAMALKLEQHKRPVADYATQALKMDQEIPKKELRNKIVHDPAATFYRPDDASDLCGCS